MSKEPTIYQFKITLKGIRPPIWRRFQVNSHLTFLDLHTIIQDVMGWYNYHLHQYFVNGLNIADQFSIDESGYGDAPTETTWVADHVNREGQKFTYEYDFGDSWEHELLLEKILEPEPDVSYPRCLKGKRACPPEDCGGIWGYEELLETIKEPQNPGYEEMMEWLGEDFDPEHFDLEEVNEILSGR